MPDRFDNQVARIDRRFDYLIEKLEAGEDIHDDLKLMEKLLPLDVVKLGMAFVLDMGERDQVNDNGTANDETVIS